MAEQDEIIRTWRRTGSIIGAARELGIGKARVRKAIEGLYEIRRYVHRKNPEPEPEPMVLIQEVWVEASVHRELRRMADASDQQIRQVVQSILREVARDEPD